MRRPIESLAYLLWGEVSRWREGMDEVGPTVGQMAEKYQETPDRIMDALDVMKIARGDEYTILPPIDWSAPPTPMGDVLERHLRVRTPEDDR